LSQRVDNYRDDEEDLHLIHEETISRAHQNRTKILGLAACNVVSTIICIILVSLLILIGIHVHNLNGQISSIENTSLTTSSCTFLNELLKRNIPTNTTDNIYFSSQFLADLHREVRENVVNSLKRQIPNSNALIYIKGAMEEYTRQNRDFLYLTGVFDAGHEVIVDVLTGLIF
jgi:hypothetical protein